MLRSLMLTLGTTSLVALSFVGGVVLEKHEAAAKRSQRVFAPSFIYVDLDEAREASSHYYCTDIIGVPDGYRLEVLPNENCNHNA